MAMRYKENRRSGSKKFSRTASFVNPKNTASPMRGGYRL